jgi:hypothetical protein
MEILGIVIALFFLVKSGGLAALGLPGGNSVPGVPVSTGFELTPQQAQFEFGQAGQLAQSVNAGINVGEQAANTATKAAASAGDISQTFATAIPIIGSAVAAVAGILLAQHTARLKGAIAENQLIPATVKAYDADIQEIAAAFNSGQITAQQAISYLHQVDQSIYSYMKANATGPGTAWREGGGACDKGCTTECCIYYNDLHAGIFGAPVFANGTVGMIPVLSGSGGQPSTGHARQVYIPKVYPPPPQYGTFTREAYWIPMNV